LCALADIIESERVVSAWVQSQQVTVRNGITSRYRVYLKVTYLLKN
jgi:flavin-binding protein dodecin